jgi:hypothetical protein
MLSRAYELPEAYAVSDPKISQSDAGRYRILLEHRKISIFTTCKLSVPVTETRTRVLESVCSRDSRVFCRENEEGPVIVSFQRTYVVLDFKTSIAHAIFEMELEFLPERHKRQSLQFGYSEVGAEILQVQRAGTVPTLEWPNPTSSDANSTFTVALGLRAPALPLIMTISILTLSQKGANGLNSADRSIPDVHPISRLRVAIRFASIEIDTLKRSL